MGRAPCCDKTTVKRGPWSREEDALLKNFIEAYGTGGNWIALPRKAGLNRCGKSCRLRWLNYLRPNIRHGGFTEEEDQIICALFSVLGSRWSVIASKLHGRTDNDVKNYWNTKLKKKIASGRVPGFQPRSVCTNNNKVDNYPNCTQPVQPNPQPFPAMKPEPESFAYDHGYNFTMASSSIINNGAISSMPYSSALGMTNNSPWVPGQQRWDPVHETSGQSELPPSSRSSSIGGGGEEVEEDDMDDFWLKLLVDQSTFFEGSSTSQVVGHEKINGFGSVLDGPFYPSLC